jgi:hypothetical protein
VDGAWLRGGLSGDFGFTFLFFFRGVSRVATSSASVSSGEISPSSTNVSASEELSCIVWIAGIARIASGSWVKNPS